jgi:hypothetical protein
MSSNFCPELYKLFEYIELLRSSTKSKQTNSSSSKHYTQYTSPIETPTLLHFTIGAPMEELKRLELSRLKASFQIYQLVPEHLYSAAKAGYRVINIIVCPNTMKTPHFLETGDFVKVSECIPSEKIKNQNTNMQISQDVYVHKFYDFSVVIFNTMMPTNDKVRNEKYMDHFKSSNILTFFEAFKIEEYFQTQSDNDFTKIFYENIGMILDHVIRCGGTSSCFSFAVFNDASLNSKFNNFTMFRELPREFTMRNLYVCEWIFKYDVYFVQNFKNRYQEIIFIPMHVFTTLKMKNTRHKNNVFLSVHKKPNGIYLSISKSEKSDLKNQI